MIKGYKGNTEIGLLFSGGPASSANAVISSVCLSFLNHDIAIIGIFSGFEFMQNYDPQNPSSFLKPGLHYKHMNADIGEIRNRRGVYLKTSRANPGKNIKNREDLNNPDKNQRLYNILNALDSLGIGFLITIGGDDTLKTANYLSLLGLPVIHIPKTIDNDYFGISWTFGYWSAVQACKDVLLSLKSDSESTGNYFLVEMMGRKAGWLTYAAGICGEATMMVSAEDIEGEELDLQDLADKIVDIILGREKRGKYYGILCMAEGLADKLPLHLRSTEVDKHGNVVLGAAEVGRLIRSAVTQRYYERTGKMKKIIYKQLGYETRAVPPISFDVVLGCMLGFGAFKLYSRLEFNSMVSVSDNFQVIPVPFSQLVDECTLLTRLRDVPSGSDFYELKEALTFMHQDYEKSNHY